MKTFNEWSKNYNENNISNDPRVLLNNLYANLDYCIGKGSLDPFWGEKLKDHVRLIQQAMQQSNEM